MKCCLNGVHINEVPKFLAESPSVTTNAFQLADPFGTAHPLIILLQLIGVTSYFELNSLSIAEYENEEIQKIPYCQRTSMGYIDKSIFRMRDLYLRSMRSDKHPCNSSKGPVFVSTAILHSLAYDATHE